MEQSHFLHSFLESLHQTLHDLDLRWEDLRVWSVVYAKSPKDHKGNRKPVEVSWISQQLGMTPSHVQSSLYRLRNRTLIKTVQRLKENRYTTQVETVLPYFWDQTFKTFYQTNLKKFTK